MTLLQKVAQAILIQYDTEQLGDAFVTGADTMQYNNSKQTLLLKWLYTLQEVGAQKLVFEMPQPEQVRFFENRFLSTYLSRQSMSTFIK